MPCVAETVALAMVTGKEGLDHPGSNAITFHPLAIGMAGNADLGVENLCATGAEPGGLPYMVKAVTIVAGGGIIVAGNNRAAVNRRGIVLLIVTAPAGRDRDPFFPLPTLAEVQLLMAVTAADTGSLMNASLYLGRYLPVASGAVDFEGRINIIRMI